MQCIEAIASEERGILQQTMLMARETPIPKCITPTQTGTGKVALQRRIAYRVLSNFAVIAFGLRLEQQ